MYMPYSCHAVESFVLSMILTHVATFSIKSSYNIVKKFCKYNTLLDRRVGNFLFLFIYIHNNLTLIMSSDFYLKITLFQESIYEHDEYSMKYKEKYFMIFLKGNL
jgi:hypothetical protein